MSPKNNSKKESKIIDVDDLHNEDKGDSSSGETPPAEAQSVAVTGEDVPSTASPPPIASAGKEGWSQDDRTRRRLPRQKR